MNYIQVPLSSGRHAEMCACSAEPWLQVHMSLTGPNVQLEPIIIILIIYNFELV